jgi:DNA-binding response OmpR family regulator
MPSSRIILIIDDDAQIRQTMARVLRQAGWEVSTAGSGQEALQLLSANLTDLVYLDLRMPEMSGLETLKEIRRLYPDLPVILLTAYGTLHSSVEALRLGVTDYLLKPINADKLVERTQQVMREQAVDRRRKEIECQIEALKNELESLKAEPAVEFHSLGPNPHLEQRTLQVGQLILDLPTRRATLAGEVLALSPGAFDYLVVLSRHSPEIVNYQTLVVEAQGYKTDPNEARDLAKRQIHLIRQALEQTASHSIELVTERHIGYRLLAD